MALLATSRLSRRCVQAFAAPLGLPSCTTPSSGSVRCLHLFLQQAGAARRPSAQHLARAVSSTRFVGSKFSVVNEDIDARAVSIVGDDGQVRQGVPLRRAIDEARAKGVDLVQVSHSGGHVVCRMFDAKKRAFAMKKAVKQQKPRPDKEVSFTPKIAPHDLQVKINQLTKFLGKGHKVKVAVKFGNQFHLKESALEQLEGIKQAIGDDVGTADAGPRLQFGGVYIFFAPAK